MVGMVVEGRRKSSKGCEQEEPLFTRRGLPIELTKHFWRPATDASSPTVHRLRFHSLLAPTSIENASPMLRHVTWLPPVYSNASYLSHCCLHHVPQFPYRQGGTLSLHILDSISNGSPVCCLILEQTVYMVHTAMVHARCSTRSFFSASFRRSDTCRWRLFHPDCTS
ncbi:hypothetical protein K439DRAFT_722659 [Ramaria rubella]|nr:hypothetical protein K439DRAFT_722659 [Ramaria rubella]